MLGKLYLVVMAIFTLAHSGPVIGDGDALVHIFEDYDNSNVITSPEDLPSTVSSLTADVNDKRLQYYLWMKRAADGARSGGMGRSKQLRYHHCYFNPISCFKKRAYESSKISDSYIGRW
ncbi:uncharacterized protein LOC124312662 [Daphnia pulicaria]|uniref:uncharacterized protein LOC124312662 n=1 Tax=Daphnia pulicaria TaxID=35523 RepID=UPI001EECA91F|nr:uncharacterized protein LOC124312662 [Daphnia pulicaria]